MNLRLEAAKEQIRRASKAGRSGRYVAKPVDSGRAAAVKDAADSWTARREEALRRIVAEDRELLERLAK